MDLVECGWVVVCFVVCYGWLLHRYVVVVVFYRNVIVFLYFLTLPIIRESMGCGGVIVFVGDFNILLTIFGRLVAYI